MRRSDYGCNEWLILVLRLRLNRSDVSRECCDERCRGTCPSCTEQEWTTLEGTIPGTALRVSVETGPGGYVRLQQLEWVEGMGWVIQKSMVIPGELLGTLATQFRRADCLIPRNAANTPRPGSGGLRLHVCNDVEDEADDLRQRA